MTVSGEAQAFVLGLLTQSLGASLGVPFASADSPGPQAAAEDPAVKLARLRLTDGLEDAFRAICVALQPKIVMEIGAHAAEFSRSMRARLPDARVVAFEGHPQVASDNAEACQAAGVEYLHACVADAPGHIDFRVPFRRDTGQRIRKMGSMLPDSVLKARKNMDFDVFRVPAVTIDAFLGDEAADAAKVMWVDVEGAAGTVLGGAKRALASCHALYVELERTARWDGQLVDLEVFSMLAPLGLRPVLRDIQRPWQYNALLLSDEAIANPQVQKICADFVVALAQRDAMPAGAGGAEDTKQILDPVRAMQRRRRQGLTAAEGAA